MSRPPVTMRAAVVVALVASALIAPDRLERGPDLCLVRRVTGRPCPTCGMTRSWSAMSRLQVGRAAGFHPLGPVAWAAGAALALGGARAERAVRTAPSWVLAPLLTLWVGVWAYRFTRGGGPSRP